MKKIDLITIGADVEMFLKDKETGEVVSSEGIIRGSKYDPFKFDKNNEYYSTSLDNVLTEITIPPAKTSKEFIAYLSKAMAFVRNSIPKNLDILVSPSANLDERFLLTENAQLFGCEPDFSAYTRMINPKPFAEDPTLRSCGGHIHLGYKNIEQEYNGVIHQYKVDDQRAEIVKSLDLFLSVPLVIMEPPNKRKELYGNAGAFRPKEYGLEYRTISNIYLLNDKFKKWAFDSAKNAIDYINENGYLNTNLSNYIQKTIDKNDEKMANILINDFKLALI